MKTLGKMFGNMTYIFSLMCKQQKSYFVFWVLRCLLTVASTWTTVILLKVIIQSLTDGETRKALVYAVVFPVTILILGIGSDRIALVNASEERKMNNYLKAELAEKWLQMPFEQTEAHAQKVDYDFARKAVSEGNAGKVLGNLGSIVSGFVSMCSVLYIFSNLHLGIVLLLCIVVCVNSVGNIKRMEYRYQEIYDQTPIEIGMYYARDYLTGPIFAKEVRSYGLKDYITGKIRTAIEDYFELEKKTTKLYYKRFWWTYAVNGIWVASVYLYIGHLLYTGFLSVSDFTFYVSAALVFASSLLGNITDVAEMLQSGRYVGALRHFLEWKPVVFDAKLPDVEKEGFRLTFENVSFRYSEDAPYVIQDISLKLTNGEKLCIVGRNGAGKTTLVKLMMGLYQPTEGTIRLNGVDIRSFDPSQYLELFSTVFQDFNMFAFSLGENIAMNEEYRDAALKNTLDMVGLAKKVESFPKGVDTYLTERMEDEGIGLSGGEQQMLALARAVYKDAPCCILDEPTAALSPQNEYEVYRKFHDITVDKTVIFISHRMAICRLADRIILLDKGRIAEVGSHKELMDLGGKYAELFSLQAEHYVAKEVEAGEK